MSYLNQKTEPKACIHAYSATIATCKFKLHATFLVVDYEQAIYNAYIHQFPDVPVMAGASSIGSKCFTAKWPNLKLMLMAADGIMEVLTQIDPDEIIIKGVIWLHSIIIQSHSICININRINLIRNPILQSTNCKKATCSRCLRRRN